MHEEPPEQEYESFTAGVSSNESGMRLDSFLAGRIAGWSRARIRRLIEDGEVLVAGRVVKPSHRLRVTDIVEAELVTASSLTSFLPENIPLDIIYEDADLLVVNKPAGLVVHPGAGVGLGTLANGLAYHFQQLSTRSGEIRPGIVHRLDKNTSGLVAVAKTDSAHETLADQFRSREVFKSYVAMVHGVMPQDHGTIEEPIGRDERRRVRMAVVRGGRTAVSIYRVRQRFERFSVLDVEIKTGRTHQIRVHMAWLKHPIVGDNLYGDGRDKTVPDPRIRSSISRLGRHFLHAEQLGFRHPRSHEMLRFKAPVPDELVGLLERIEKKEGEW